MIVAVEGPSAAGKTTWCKRAGLRFVAEYLPTRVEPDGSDPEEQARYWTEVNARRWMRARELEEQIGVAVCDSDPLKLHYSWCLAAVGAGPVVRFERELAAVRQAFTQRRLGFADVVLLSIPEPQQLAAQRAGDPTRRRRHFELHAQLAEPLRQWYSALGRLDPGRVVDGFPTELGDAIPEAPRTDRCDRDLLDSLVDELPAL
ncbi:hypothetical protein ACFXK0_07395 [Nocardia sp. NPDC059177]|uniref:hypothetical protein n=1 Tax=Nocardia sp. NPDC059177 TaxID=3346759 RepID=UPI00367FE5B0